MPKSVEAYNVNRLVVGTQLRIPMTIDRLAISHDRNSTLRLLVAGSGGYSCRACFQCGDDSVGIDRCNCGICGGPCYFGRCNSFVIYRDLELISITLQESYRKPIQHNRINQNRIFYNKTISIIVIRYCIVNICRWIVRNPYFIFFYDLLLLIPNFRVRIMKGTTK